MWAGLTMRNILILAIAAAAAPLAVPAPAPPAGWTDGYVMANGIRIHYWRTGGNKTPLVLAHGSSDDGLCWTNLAKELQNDYDIIMFDARGHGMTDPPVKGDPADVQVEDLAALIRELKLTKPILMGHSMGSASVAWFASKYPDIPRGVVLEDPGLVRRPNAPLPPGVPADPDERRAGILARNNMTEEQLVAGCMKDSPKWGRSECEIWAPSKRRHHPNTALGTMAGRPPMSELFPKITAPTLILKADAQGELRAQSEQIARLLKNGKIVHIEGAAHNVRRDQKQRTLEVLKPFLAGL
jgi:pimeloyl-ACP methyl ester carboxylesterase